MVVYYTIALIAILGAISPGPDFLVVTKHAIAHHRYNAIFASFGISAGILVHTTYCVLGLALIISHSIVLFSIIKYLGASYLVYLGVKSLISKSSNATPMIVSPIKNSLGFSFRDGLLTNVLNPKCTLYMFSIFTLVINPHTSRLIQATYGLEIAFISLFWFVFLSYGLTINVIKRQLDKAQRVVNKLIGGVLIALGIFVVFESR